MPKWTQIRVRKSTHDKLVTLLGGLEAKVKRRIYFWEVFEVLLEGWNLLGDDLRDEAIESVLVRKGKVVVGGGR